jgi:hypothetical protein
LASVASINFIYAQENRKMLQVFNLVRECHGADETTEEVGLLLAGMRSSCDMALGAHFRNVISWAPDF